MATIDPTFSAAAGVIRTQWASITASDTVTGFTIKGNSGSSAAVQISGTFGGATVALQGSNDGTNWYTLKNVHGTDISVTSAALHEFKTSAVYIRPAITGGAGYTLNVISVLRGV